ncbi:hypothetical protein [Paramixta manurensis]|uniref:hypothetical protein n=1 Tax=Paramixta manurensis TaxID=2740817 RepID=UPI00156AEAC3
MNEEQRKNIEMAATTAVITSLISLPFVGLWGLAVGPALVAMFAWAYYSMVGFVWFIEKITGRKL